MSEAVNQAMVELIDVTIDHPRGGSPLVTHASLRVNTGEVVVIVGAAGVGTSRIVAATLGEVAADEGTIGVLGRDVAKLRRSSLRLLRRRVGIVRRICVSSRIAARSSSRAAARDRWHPALGVVLRAATVLAQMGLEDEASLPVDCLSASARQRVAVARALVREPEPESSPTIRPARRTPRAPSASGNVLRGREPRLVGAGVGGPGLA